MDILGYLLDKYQWISLMDMWLGYIWICLDIFGYFQWISFLDMSEKISYFAQRYPRDILSYPTISNDIQRYPTISRDIQMGRIPR
jgi:hypothetical protein